MVKKGKRPKRASLGEGCESSSSVPAVDWQVDSRKPRLRQPPSKKPCDVNERGRSEVSTVSTNNSNRYSILEQQIDTSAPAPPKVPAPPPIFLPGVSNIQNMLRTLSNVCGGEFTYKTLGNGDIKVNISTVEKFRKMTDYLNTNKVKYHTYQLKQERAFRVVMRGMHPQADVEQLKEEIDKLGYSVRNVTNIKSRREKTPLPLFFVDLEPAVGNKNIYNVRSVGNCRVTFEQPHQRNELVQCHRCQLFGHTKAYCKRAPACVKCGLGHLTAECKKSPSSPAKCLHCLQNHPANYRGCIIYQQILNRRQPQQPGRFQASRAVPAFNGSNFPTLNPSKVIPTPINNPSLVKPIVSYSQMTGNAGNPTSSVNYNNPSVNNLVLTAINELKNMVFELTNAIKIICADIIPRQCP